MKVREILLPNYGIHLYESKHNEGNVVNEHHHHIHQILYAIEGQGEILLDGKKYNITQDQFALIVPNSSHSIFSHSRLTLLVLAFDIHSFGTFGEHELNDELFNVSQFFNPNPISSSELRQTLRKMLYEQTSEDSFSGWALKIHLLQILLIIIRSGEKSHIQDTNSLRSERIKNYIDTYYYEPLTTNEIAAKLGISSRYVNTIFKEYYHKTPTQYLTEVRIEIAKKLLTNTNKDIVTICFEIGYETLSTFYRAFKNTMNISPNQYRRLNQDH
ncbi:AraC family transcriptional regulator [Lederbergia citrea]|uniref:Helix-turn-helix domain-containing protein n=2 Tax=Lederbergia citrea TaxID=2833581 RepID=A0A942URD3_9BACI|nr:AraC family transcriptional regulator [Lederbergia citrea]MBS4222619.1 helix-turn-helix domain-containing protein [Lederbergia citrea]